MAQYTVSMVFKAIDQATRPLQRIGGAVGRIGAAASGAAAGFGRAALGIGRTAAYIGAAVYSGAGLAVAAAGRTIVRTSAQFEDFGAVLETVEGSAAKARAAFQWLNKVEAETPYDLAQLTDAYVQLRSYGLDPTKGLLRTLGDTAAAMNKPLAQAVEAVADAVTGENERLKEFGIVARKAGETIVYSYTSAGKQMTKSAKANSRAQIEATLAAIWNEKYGGAMEKRSQTFNGLMSTLGSEWQRFQQMVGEAGVLDMFKQGLSDVLALIGRLRETGQLQALADTLGRVLVTAGGMARDALTAVWRVIGAISDALAPLAPTFDAGLAASRAMGQSLLGWMPQARDVGQGLARAVQWLGETFQFLQPLAQGVFDLMVGLWQVAGPPLVALFETLAGVVNKLGVVLRPVAEALGGAMSSVGKWLGGQSRAAGDGKLAGGAGLDRLARSGRQEVGGEIVVRLEGAPKGSRVEAVRPKGGIDLGLELGMAMGG